MQKNINKYGKWLINRIQVAVFWLRQKSLFKWLLSFVGTITVLMFLGICLLILFFDPNDYKIEIADWLKTTTGRTFDLQDDIAYTFYPWLGLDLGKVTIGNAPDFEPPIFAHIGTAQVRIKLLPLLKKQFEIDTVRLEGMKVNLMRKLDGSTNWEDLLTLGSTHDEQPQDSSNLDKFKLKGLDVRHAQIYFDDQQNQSYYRFSDLTLQTSAFQLNQPLKIKFKTALDVSSATQFSGQVDFQTQISFDLNKQYYQLAPLQLNVTLQDDDILAGSQTVLLNTEEITIDLIQQNLTFGEVRAEAMGAILTGHLHAQNLFTHPILAGQVQLTSSNLQPLLKSFNVPALPSEQLLKTVHLETDFDLNLNDLSLTQFQFLLDDHHLNLKIPRLQIDFSQQRLEVPTLLLQAFGIHLDGQIQIQQLFAVPQANGQLVLTPVNLRDTLKHLEDVKLLPPLSLPDAQLWPLNKATLQTNFHVKDTEIILKNMHLRLDEHTLEARQLNWDWQQEKLAASAFTLNVLGLTLLGKLDIKKMFSDVKLRANLSLEPFNPQQILKRLGQVPLELPTALLPLTYATLKTQVKVSSTEVTLKDLALTVDNHQFNGKYFNYHFAKDTLVSTDFAVKMLKLATVIGQFSVQQLSTQPTFEATLKLLPVNLRQVAEYFGQPLPKMTDPKALTQLASETQLHGNLAKIQLDKLKIQIDDSLLQGHFQIHDGQKPAAVFNLEVDKVDVNRYLPPKSAKKSDSVPPSGEEIVPTLESFHNLVLNGTLKVGKLKISVFQIDDINLDVSTKHGKIKVTPRNSLFLPSFKF
jgi:AsmA protein